jgi:hypothetical protein
LTQLAHALTHDLGAAEPVLAELRAGVSGAALEPEIAAIAAEVEVFAIDAALELLNALQAGLPSPPGVHST